MRHVFVGVITALLVAGLFAPVVFATDPAVAKVVVIVGPSGDATNRYRAEARDAADEARRYTPDVTELYSPDATWPAVKKALQGASLVIYMGHGNGWPSKYRDELYPPTQNGFGLNPSPGSGDYTHQYFGEAKVAKSVRLADNAVVLLNHLCYASGNTEPGLAEGSLDQARQRVDNFAAGFIKAGAAAVVAEAYASPSRMVRMVLGGRGTIEKAWRGAPTANSNGFAFESVRSPGYVAQMDPEHGDSGFSRSIVLKSGLASADVLRSARGSANRRATPPIEPALLVPTLVGTGLKTSTPTLSGSSVTGSKLSYRIPFKIADRDQLPDAVQASFRWDPLDPPIADPAVADPAVADPAVADPAAGDPAVTTEGAQEAPDFGLVAVERLGDVVTPAKLKIAKTRMSINLRAPATPGRYRLTVTLHDMDGVAYDATTQAMVPNLIVRVTSEHDAGIVAPPQIDIAPGDAYSMPLWIGNLGRYVWGELAVPGKRTTHGSRNQAGVTPATFARVTGIWVALGGLDDPIQQAAAAAASVTPFGLRAAMEPGAVVQANLAMFAPSAPGDYLLVLDVLTPEAGSLAALGVEPTTIRVHVAVPAPAPTPVVAPTLGTEAVPGAQAAPGAEPEASPTPVVSPAPKATPAASNAAPATTPAS